MTSVDERIVSMQFDNGQFERRLGDTLQSLDKLQKSLDFSNSRHGVDELSSSINKFDMSHMAAAVENISSKFSALGAVGFSVISNLTNSVMSFVSGMISTAKQDILGPIITGGTQRAQNIEQAKFQFRGLGMDVEKGMQSALDAVKGTAYGLDEAAKVAAQFGASGIKAGDQMTSALRGIAGAAAMTGTSFSEMGAIFTSSAGSGKVNNQDLMQFATRGLNAAAAVGKVMGKSEAQIHEMATKGTLDFATFAAAMDKAFGSHATQANETYAGSLANMHAAMSRLGASIEGPKLEQQRVLFNTLTPVIDNVSKALKPLIDQFLAIRKVGSDNLVQMLKNLDLKNFTKSIANVALALKNAFAGFERLLIPIKTAFKDIFPPSTTSTMLEISKAILNMSKHFKMGIDTLKEIRRVFDGFFSAIEIGWTVIKETAKLIKDIFPNLNGAAGGALEFAAKIGDTLTRWDASLVAGGGIHDVFVKIGDAIKHPLDTLDALRDKIVKFATSFSSVSDFVKSAQDHIESFLGLMGKFSDKVVGVDNLDGAFGRVNQRLDGLRAIGARVSDVWDRLGGTMDRITGVMSRVWKFISSFFKDLGKALAASVQPGDFDSAVDAVNFGLLAAIGTMLEKFVNGGLKVNIGDGIFQKMGAALDALQGKLKAMTANVKADTLMKIATAVGILTVSMVALSMINSDDLTKALLAMSGGFAQLVGTMAVLDQIASDTKGAAKLAILAAGMDLIAGAMVILAGAVKIMATMSWEELARGLAGTTAMLIGITSTTKLISADTDGMVRAGIAMVGIAIAMTILAEAVKLFAQMSWGDLVKGLAGAAVGLTMVTVASNAMPEGMVAQGIGIIGIATGLLILSQAVQSFATMSWGEMGKGLTGIAIALGILAIAMNAMPVWLPEIGAGLILVGAGLLVMSQVIQSFGGTDIGTLAKGIGSLAAMLLILAIGVNAMDGAAGGAAALLVTAGALVVLTAVLDHLGHMSWADIGKGLAAVAAVLAVLAIGALLIGPVLPELFALGVALGLIGASFALFGIGVMSVATGFRILAEAGKAGAKAMVDALLVLVEAIPKVLAALVISIGTSAGDILKAGGFLIKMAGVLLLQLLQAVIPLIPPIGQAIGAFLTMALKLIRDQAPDIIATGYFVLITLLKSVRDHIDELTTLGVDILVKLLNAFADNTWRIVNAGVDILLNFMSGITNRMNDITRMGADVIVALISGMASNANKVVTAGTDLIGLLVSSMAANANRLVTTGANAIISFITGIGNNANRIVTAGTDTIISFIQGLGSNSIRLANAAADTLIAFMNGLTDAINKHQKEFNDAGWRLGVAIMDGASGGLFSKVKDLTEGAAGIFRGVIKAVRGAIDSNSPSKEFFAIGQDMMAGTAIAIKSDTSVQNHAVASAERIIQAFHETLSQVPDSLAGMEEFNPVISPVLDLTRVKQGASMIDQMMATSSLNAGLSLLQARQISAATQPVPDDASSSSSAPADITFVQNNYSPKELSTNDIYRNTRSVIALAKEELQIP